MIIHSEPQGSLEWLARRAGVVTASEMDNILTPTFARRTGEMWNSYLCRKLAEKWIGSPLAGFQSLDMEFGQILEEECLPWYSLEFDTPLQRVGLITDDLGLVGCSPDALIGEDGGLEAKCPRADNHMKHLLGGVVPKGYLVQVHAALFVTGRPWWKFVSYHRRLPTLVVTVERDTKIQDHISDAVVQFLFEFGEAWSRLVAINGGPPRRTTSAAREKQENQFVSETPT